MSIIDWFIDLDVGIGHGLRNKFGESVAEGSDKTALYYVSTAYFVLGAIVVVAAILFLFGNLFIPWANWLNTDPDLSSEIRILVVFIIIAFAIRFVSAMVYELIYALQKMALIFPFD